MGLIKKQNRPEEASENTGGKLTANELAQASYCLPSGKKYSIPLILAGAALFFGMAGSAMPFVGALLGVAAIIVRQKAGIAPSRQKAPRATVALAVAGIAFSLLLSFYQPKPGVITVRIDAPEWQESYGAVTVNVKGTTEEGESFRDTFKVTPGSKQVLDDYSVGTYTFSVDAKNLEQGDALFEVTSKDLTCKLENEKDETVEISLAFVPEDGKLTVKFSDGIDQLKHVEAFTVRVEGSLKSGEAFSDSFTLAYGSMKDLSSYQKGDYTFSVEPNSVTVDDTVYSISSKSCSFNKRDDAKVTLDIKVDEQATRELAEQRAAEEEAARAAAEESQAQPQETTVYITNQGSKYHRAGCRYLKSSCIETTLSSALGMGYEPCKVCNPPTQ